MNGDLTPDQVTPRSSRKVWWKCIREHEWKARLADRTGGTGCPYCAGKKASKEYNLAVKQPGLAKEWHPTKNGDLTPDQFTPGSHMKVWWRCSEGHEWESVIKNRTNGSGCSFCYRERRQRAKKENTWLNHPTRIENKLQYNSSNIPTGF